MSEAKILIVDDEAAERITLGEALRLEGFAVTLAASGEEAIALVTADRGFDALILDLRLPGMDGIAVLDQARRLLPEAVVILLTGYGTLESAIQAMRRGAYDYLLKPARPDEIIATLRRGLEEQRQEKQRRALVGQLQNTLQALIAMDGATPAPQQTEAPLDQDRFRRIGDILMDRARHLVTCKGQPVDLTPTEFRLLECLMARVDQVCTPQDLVACAQGYDSDPWGARSIVRVHVRRLRRKLEPDPENPRYIVNVRGVGYMFVSTPEKANAYAGISDDDA